MKTSSVDSPEAKHWRHQKSDFFKAFPHYADGPLLNALNAQVQRIAVLPCYSGKSAADILIEAMKMVQEHLEGLTEESRAFGLSTFGEKLLDTQCSVSRQSAALRFYLNNCFSFDQADSGKAAIVENICDQLDRDIAGLEVLYKTIQGLEP